MRVTSSENPVFRLSKPLQFQTWTSWNYQPYLFWHDDFAVGDFLFFLLLLLQQSELVWSDLKWLSNLGALLYPEKTCMCGISPLSKPGVSQQDGSQLQKH